MKTVYKLICCFLLTAGCMLLVSCNNTKVLKSFDFAVIETTSQNNKSYISFYNKNLQKVTESEIKYGSMGSCYDLPKIYKDSMYVIPKGIGNSKELKIIFRYDLKTGKTMTYNLDEQNMNSFCVNDNFLFGVSTWNNNSNISRLDLKSNKINKLTFENEYVCKMDLYGDMLYAFSTSKSKSSIKTYLYVIDINNFKVVNKFDISSCGINQFYTCKVSDDIYFTSNNNVSSDMKSETPSTTLTKYNIKDKSFTGITLNNENPFQIIQYKRKLIISHFDPVQLRGDSITVYDLDTKEQKIVTLKNELYQISIKGDKLYSTDGLNKMYTYRINEDYSFDLLNAQSIKTSRNDGNYYYNGGFFFGAK